MKNPILYFLLFAVGIMVLVNCHNDAPASSDEPSGYEPEIKPIEPIASTVEVATDPLPTPPVDNDTKKNIEKQLEKSPFAALGCCNEMDNWKKPCCCDKVMEKYRQMVTAKDKKLADLKTKDDILAQCRQMKKLEFDKIDHPEEEEVKF